MKIVTFVAAAYVLGVVIAGGAYLWVTSLQTFGGGFAVISPASCVTRISTTGGNTFLMHDCTFKGAYVLAGLYFLAVWTAFLVALAWRR